MDIEIIKLEPSFQRGGGRWGLIIDPATLPSRFTIKEHAIYRFPPGVIGGNHKHPRSEIMIGIGNITIHWIDSVGQHHEQIMDTEQELTAFYIPPFVPHAVINNSKTDPAVIYEYADDVQHDVTPEQVINITENRP